MKQNLLARLDDKSRGLINAISQLAQTLKVRVYLVGGPVRDLLMENQSLDLDIMVEGDAMRLAKLYAKQMQVDYVMYPAFLTASVSLSNRRRVDFATARQEIYKRPGAFPTVTKADIKEDLFRRDFTVNAMALRLDANANGQLVDIYGGLKDLKAKRIRVLHEKSFMDDPTRILRAARFMARLGFKLERQTAVLLKEAMAQQALNSITRNRYMKEYNKILLEESKDEALNILKRWGIS